MEDGAPKLSVAVLFERVATELYDLAQKLDQAQHAAVPCATCKPISSADISNLQALDLATQSVGDFASLFRSMSHESTFANQELPMAALGGLKLLSLRSSLEAGRNDAENAAPNRDESGVDTSFLL